MNGNDVPIANLARESVAVARSQPLLSLATILLLTAACAAALATTGQTVAAEQQVLSRISEETARTVVVRARTPEAGLHPEAIVRIQRLTTVEWAAGLTFARDARNATIHGGRRIPVRTLHADPGDIPALELDASRLPPDGTLLTPTTQRDLSMRHVVGAVEFADRHQLPVVGRYRASGPLGFLEDSALHLPKPSGDHEPLHTVHLLVTTPQAVEPTARAALSVLDADEPEQIHTETATELAELRRLIAGDLGRFGRDMLLVTLGTAGLLIGISVYTAVTLRRRELGLRRALGASRSDIIVLVVLRTLIPAVAGAIIGLVTGAYLVYRWTSSWPDLSFATSLAVLATTAAGLAALPPALIAAYRDPVRALRVP